MEFIPVLLRQHIQPVTPRTAVSLRKIDRFLNCMIGIIMRRSLPKMLWICSLSLSALCIGSTSYAAPTLSIDESYDFTTPSHMSYAASITDTSGTTLTKDMCSKLQLGGETPVFESNGSAHTCRISADYEGSSLSQFLTISEGGFSFSSQTSIILAGITDGANTSDNSPTVNINAQFPEGYVPTSADTPGEVDPAKRTVRWTNAPSIVSATGEIDSTQQAAPSASTNDDQPSSQNERQGVPGKYISIFVCFLAAITAWTVRLRKGKDYRPAQHQQR